MGLDPDRIRGALLGVAVGDALGLPCENLRPRTIARRFGALDRYGLFLGTGWISDDTEQTAMVAEALLAQGRAGADAVARAFAWKLRLWFLLLPAGIGFATVRACLKLFLGFSPAKSGVRSAGNGAAMRSIPVALAASEDELARDALARALARVTHTDERGVDGARLVAHAAARLLGGAVLIRDLVTHVKPHPDLASALERAAVLLERGAGADEAGRELGTTGFVVHTVPFALFCALRFDNFADAVKAAVRAGGDTDTIAAIAGGLAGARFGASAIPEKWLTTLEARGRGRRHLEALAAAFTDGSVPRPSLAYRVVRAPFFLGIVLLEGFRRFLDAPIAIARGEWSQ
jgi:ADP-ribosylglycohydrolase